MQPRLVTSAWSMWAGRPLATASFTPVSWTAANAARTRDVTWMPAWTMVSSKSRKTSPTFWERRAGPRMPLASVCELLTKAAVHEGNEGVESRSLVSAVARDLNGGAVAETSSEDHHDGLGVHGSGALVDVGDGDLGLILLSLGDEDGSGTSVKAGSVDDLRLLRNHGALL